MCAYSWSKSGGVSKLVYKTLACMHLYTRQSQKLKLLYMYYELIVSSTTFFHFPFPHSFLISTFFSAEAFTVSVFRRPWYKLFIFSFHTISSIIVHSFFSLYPVSFITKNSVCYKYSMLLSYNLNIWRRNVMSLNRIFI